MLGEFLSAARAFIFCRESVTYDHTLATTTLVVASYYSKTPSLLDLCSHHFQAIFFLQHNMESRDIYSHATIDSNYKFACFFFKFHDGYSIVKPSIQTIVFSTILILMFFTSSLTVLTAMFKVSI